MHPLEEETLKAINNLINPACRYLGIALPSGESILQGLPNLVIPEILRMCVKEEPFTKRMGSKPRPSGQLFLDSQRTNQFPKHIILSSVCH
jgi:hypothetical protein